MMRIATVLTLLLAASIAVAAENPAPGDVAAGSVVGGGMGFTLITTNGYVSFIAGDEWGVIQIQSRPPIAAAAFQIPDPADQGTNDSTNLIISLYRSGDAKAEAALVNLRSLHKAWKTGVDGDWSVAETDAQQRGTLYTILDADKLCGDVVCGVRLAWPHLESHKNYDALMRSTFKVFLASVRTGSGPYHVHDGETIRRSEN
jgi:hypothetical protein